MTRCPASDRAVTVIQGDADTTVDWRYNLKWIRRTFPHAEVFMVPGGRHQLRNEAAPLRAQVIDRLTATLSGGACKISR